MKPNKPLEEIIIVISVFIVLWAMSLLTSYFWGNRSIDINLHDTYDILGSIWTNSVFPAFLWLITVIYLIRGARNKFKNRLQNLILLISNACLNIVMLIYFKDAARYSGMSIHFNPESENIMETSFIIQVILILLLAIIAGITAKNWNTNKNAS